MLKNAGAVMHIIAGVLGLLGAVAFFLYRMDAARQNAHRVGEAANDTRLFFRRTRWNHKRKFRPVNEINDSRLAATVMMVALAHDTGAMTEQTIAVIKQQLTTVLQFSDAEAEEIFAQAKWYAQDMGDVDTAIDKIRRRMEPELDAQQRKDVVAMLTTVAAADGEIDVLQQQSINRLKNAWEL